MTRKGETRNKLNNYLENNKNEIINRFNEISISKLGKEINCSTSHLHRTLKKWNCVTSRHNRLKENNESPAWTGYGEISGLKWCGIKHCAKKRNIQFNITIEEAWNLFIKQNRKCALSGLDLFLPKTKKLKDKGNASLDRINSEKSYTKENCQWIDKRINKMKMSLNELEFINLCKMIADYKEY